MKLSLLKEHFIHLEKHLMTNGHKVFNEYLADDFVEVTITDFTIKMLTTDVVLATYRTFVHHNSKYALRSSI
ncbi:hypothetical protein [Bacillus sp. SA1-12]|uniref:hypothetical protein n=1 Tax=Bacillus sp. SA1-12 TaxID=1455638 RepID=UPI0006990DCB|nr:hypothetical protein [Bacillus sp. SA1-12]